MPSGPPESPVDSFTPLAESLKGQGANGAIMTRVIHTADTHIGYRQYNSPERRRDFLDAFERVLDDAIEMDVDAVIHAGDVFHDRRPGLPDLLGTISALRELAAADVPFLAVVGNHEDKRDAQWLDLFEELDLAIRLDETGTVIGETTFYGLDHVPRSQRDQVDYEFESPETDNTALVAHGLFEPFAHADWDTEEVLEQSNVDFDVLLLGDNHVPDTAQVDGTWVTYSGSTERVSASEEADRSYNVVEFGAEENAEDVRISRRGLPTREFEFVDVELHEGEGLERVRDRVAEYDCEDAVVVVRVDGEGKPIPPATIEEFARERGALVARVNDRREIEEEETELDISFADPDEAVRERVREMGLSVAARGVDETVRASDLADSNVRDAVASEVRELIDDGLEAFEPAGGEVSDEAATAEPADGTDISDESTGNEGAGEDSTTDGAEAEPATDGANPAPDESDAGEEAASDAGEESPGDDGQVSMEDYL